MVSELVLHVFADLMIINRVVSVIDEYSGFFMVVLTAVYVATTAGLLFFERRTHILTENTLARNSRPFIVVDLCMENKVVSMRLKNVGMSPATDVSLKFTDPFKVFAGKTSDQLDWPDPIPIIAPGANLKLFLDDRQEFFTKNAEIKAIRGKIKYDGLFPMQSFDERISVSMEPYHFVAT